MCIVETPTTRARKAPAVGTLQAGLALRTLRKNSSSRQKDSFPGKKKYLKNDWRGIRTLASEETSALN